jgi:HSP20 family protein
MMSLVRFSPKKEMLKFHEDFDRMFNGFFVPSTRRWMKMDGDTAWNPVVDILDKEDAFLIKAELPGIDKKDLSVDVKDRVLTLKGERTSKDEVKEESYYRRERFYGKFERSFTLPVDVDSEKIKADYKDGVLNIVIPKPEEKKPKQITVH